MQRKQKDILPFGSVVAWQKKNQTMKTEELRDAGIFRKKENGKTLIWNKNSESLWRFR